MPNDNRHRNISYAKSVIRIIGFTALVINLYVGVALLILAEILGIEEESE